MKALIFVAAILLANGAVAAETIVELFDGKSLAGWENVDGQPVTSGWRVEDGTLFRSERSGPLYAVGQYANFELRFEWKIAPGGNSGVKYRMAYYPKGIWGTPAWLGCEYQLYDDRGAPPTSPTQTAGALYGIYEPNTKKKLKPIDEFNASKIVCDGPKIEHWLNGELIVRADTNSDEWKKRVAASKFGRADHFFENLTGRIQLQDYGHDVWFRNITLRVLDSKRVHETK